MAFLDDRWTKEIIFSELIDNYISNVEYLFNLMTLINRYLQTYKEI